MRHFLSLLFTLALASPAAAALMAENADFPDGAAPNTIRWELRTATDEFVRWDFSYPAVDAIGPWSESITVYENESTMPPWFPIDSRHTTAALAGIDWQAWQSAILNPAFNRWVVTRNGVTIEKPWTRTVLGDGTMDGITKLRFAFGKRELGYGVVNVTTVALYEPIPEPASWLMLLVGLLHGVTVVGCRNTECRR